jgi:hypothetical protein
MPSGRLDEFEKAIICVGRLFVWKVHAGRQVAEQAAREDRHVQVWRFVRAGRLHNGEVEHAFQVGSAARELVTAPHFHQPVRHRFARSIQELALDSHRVRAAGRLMTFLERKRVTKKGADRL